MTSIHDCICDIIRAFPHDCKLEIENDHNEIFMELLTPKQLENKALDNVNRYVFDIIESVIIPTMIKSFDGQIIEFTLSEPIHTQVFCELSRVVALKGWNLSVALSEGKNPEVFKLKSVDL